MPESVTSIIKIAQFGFQVADWCMNAIAPSPCFSSRSAIAVEFLNREDAKDKEARKKGRLSVFNDPVIYLAGA